MHSKWIEHQGKKIFYQDFSNLLNDSAAVKVELNEVQKIVKTEPLNSVLVLADWRNTNIHFDFLSELNAASRVTKAFVNKTAVLGSTGIKRTLSELLTTLTGQNLKYYDDIEAAKNWLVED